MSRSNKLKDRQRSEDSPGCCRNQSKKFMAPGVIWLLLAGPVWSALGAIFLPRRYRTARSDPQLAGLAGGFWGAALGPFALAPLYVAVPVLRRGLHVVVPAVLVSGELLRFSLMPILAMYASPTRFMC